MKKTAFLLIALVAFAVLIGCSTSGALSIPPTYEFNPGLAAGRQYEILGEVVLDGTTRNVVGIQVEGGKGFSEFLALAKSLYPDCDALINCYVDGQTYSGLFVESATQIYRGTAIRYK